MEWAQPSADPITQLLAIIGVAVKANCGILPAYAHGKMMTNICENISDIGCDIGVKFVGFDDSTEGAYADDVMIPRALARSVAQLPTLTSEVGVISPLSERSVNIW